MALLMQSFIILTAILNNVLYTDVPVRARDMAICFTDCTNRSNFSMMSRKVVNGGKLNTFYTLLPEGVTAYKLKIVFQDNTDGDTGWITISDGGDKNEMRISDVDFRSELRNIFGLVCFAASSLTVLLLKTVIKNVRRKVKQ